MTWQENVVVKPATKTRQNFNNFFSTVKAMFKWFSVDAGKFDGFDWLISDFSRGRTLREIFC